METIVRELPGRPASWVELPDSLDPRLARGLWQRGITRLYSHQRLALSALAAGHDVVVATPTASGKSLCYHLPVLDTLLRDASARALYLFPTKALARDQVAALRELVAACDARELGIAVYDGDTPADQRRQARNARIVATNPDMLHAGILPHHASWAGFFAGLRHVVVDELHVCRGLFGAGVANVLRRLRRVAAFHDAAPRFVATSATIGNPGELASRVLGTPPDRLRVIAESGAPAGPRTFMLVNPPVIDSALGLRASYLKVAKRVARDCVDKGMGTLVFARSRRAVEILVRYLRDDLADDGEAQQAEGVRGYRGGYLPDRRREVERLLRDGDTRCVVATSALELGIDVGGLDAVVIAGWPGSRAAAWQRAGRAGRRGDPSLVVLVASSEPLDQYVFGDPDYLFGESPEHGRVDPDNPSVLLPHLSCAAFELPFAEGERFGELSAEETRAGLRHLAGAGTLFEDPGTGSFHWIGQAYPAQAVPLRGAADENFAVIDAAAAGGAVLAEVDYRDAARQLHENAIYALEGRLYQVERLDWNARKAYVGAVDVDYTTDALAYARVRVLATIEAAPGAGWGDVHVVDRVVGFKKIKLHTHENVGYGEVALPPFEMHTRGLWLEPPPGLSDEPDADALARAAHALEHVAALLVLCEGADIGRATDVAPARIYLYDNLPGGAGLAERLYQERRDLVARALRLVIACGCKHGCPACVGALDASAALLSPSPRVRAAELLRRLAEVLA
jgi:DEAD/DEAH box helicase domain-containing protein